MKTIEFCNLYNPCNDGKAFALQFETMSEVWEACERPDWLFWILEKFKPLEKEQSVRLAIAFAEMSLVNFTNKNDKRPFEAIQAAKNWLDCPCEETMSAARSAAESAAWSAVESAARSAAWSAAQAAARSAAQAAARSAAWSAAWSATWSAESAAWSAAQAAARLNQCKMIRSSISNPFKP